jgi:hypothetical protein
LLQAIDQISYATTGDEDLFLHFAEQQLSLVIERFHHRELGEREAVTGDVARRPFGDARVGAGQHDPQLQCSCLFIHRKS